MLDSSKSVLCSVTNRYYLDHFSYIDGWSIALILSRSGTFDHEFRFSRFLSLFSISESSYFTRHLENISWKFLSEKIM